MTQSEIGAYILLLCHQWNRGSIPVEPERQQNVAKGPVSPHVLAKFQICPDGMLRNERLEQERSKQETYREKQRQKGLASGAARAKNTQPNNNHGSTTVQPSGEPKGNSPSPSPSPIKKDKSPSAPVASEHKDFIQEWASAYKLNLGRDYTFNSGRDGKAAKDLLQTQIPSGELIAIAVKAWKMMVNPKFFNCKQAATIHGFYNKLNDIRLELNPPKQTVSCVQDGALPLWKGGNL